MDKDRGSDTEASVLSDWVGYWVFISYYSGPYIDTDEPSKPVKARPEVITASFYLERYNSFGIEVKRGPEDPTIFMSWSAVLYIQGPPPDVREQIDSQMRGGNGQT